MFKKIVENKLRPILKYFNYEILGIKINKNLIIVFANYNYLPVLENWLKAIEKLEIKNYLVISLDKELHNYLKDKKIKSLFRPCEMDLGKLWIHRIKVMNKILKDGYNIIHSDADAVWLKNPLNDYFYNNTYDMIFSQGTYWPKDIYEKWNLVLCCGLFMIRSNDRTIEFFQRLKEDVKKTKDDQISFNRLLYQDGIEWILKSPYKLMYNEIYFQCSEELGIGNSENLSLALLPHHKFQRVMQDSNDIYIRHIISEKKAESKIIELKNSGCYIF